MDLRQLRYFTAIVEQGSFSKAALKLRVAQPALSQHLRHMEDELGVALLHRGTRGVQPTEAGERLLAKAWAPVEQAIEGRDYLIGDFSAADTMLGHACIMSKRLGIITDEAYPNLSAYADRLLARPACAKAFAA